MKREDLTQKLHDIYFDAKDKETVVMLHLFGIKYAEEIKNHGTPKKIASEAGIPVSYATEISKGMKLSEFVEIRPRIII